MKIGQRVMIKDENVVQQGIVIETFAEHLKIKLDSGIEVLRKYWELRKVQEDESN